jgi:crossover junction endodeoxyribonuclease RuvC
VETLILGIDPGSRVTGYGLIQCSGSNHELLDAGIWKSTEEDSANRLRHILQSALAFMRLHKPEAMAIEAPFYGKNIQSTLKLGRAQGVVIAAAFQLNIPVFEYAPRRVKQAITGNGNAGKEQVAAMLPFLLKNLSCDNLPMDATDAIAVSLCHAFGLRIGSTSQSGSSNWSSFIKSNPNRVEGG